MKIVLTQAVVSGAGWNQGSFPPLGLLYLGSSLKTVSGVRVGLVDGFGEGLSIDRTVERILAQEPDLVGVSITSRNFQEGLEVVQKIKQARPRVITVCGGIHASLFDELLLKETPALDLVLRGEAEQSFPELVRRIMARAELDGLPGLSWRKNGRIIRGRPQWISDLDALPFPDRSLLDYKGYGSQWYGFQLPRLPRMTTAFSSRGCPHSCLFCSDVTLRAPYRARSPENILEELVRIKEQGYEIVIFFDDNLTNDVQRLNRLCHLILENKLNLVLASTGMPYLLPDQTLRLMNRAGFIIMFVGVESGSDAVLRRYRKPGRRSQMAEGIRRAQQAKMFVIGSFITGLQEETGADHQATKDFIREVRPVFSDINPLMVHPGSGLWKEIHQNHPPQILAETASRLVSNFPGQQDKRVIKFRERDFRRAYARLWWRPGMVLNALRIFFANRLLTRVTKSVLGNPASLLQFWRGNQPR